MEKAVRETDGCYQLPIEVYNVGGELRVRWLVTSSLDFSVPFFSHAIDKQISALLRPAVYETTWEAFSGKTQEDAHRCSRPAGYIFHVSRCGSTLLANMVRASGNHLVLSEPGPLSAVLEWAKDDPSRYDSRALVSGMIEALSQPAHASDSRVFIKLFSHSLFRIDLLRAVTPDVPEVFLYRDPLEVLLSNLDWPNQDWIWREEFTGVSSDTARLLPVAELFARGIGLAMQVMLEKRRANTTLFNYSDIGVPTAAKLAKALRFDLPPSRLPAVWKMLEWSAKDQRRERFLKANELQKREQASPQIRQLVNTFASNAYSELEELRLAQQDH
jgi:hypothetical protein